MAEVLVLVEHINGDVKKVTSELLTLACTLGEPSAVFVGAGFDSARDRLAEHGAVRVYVADSADVLESVAGPKVAVLAQLVADRAPAAVLLASNAEGKEIAGRLAVRTGSGVLTDAVAVDPELRVTQSVFGGSTVVTTRVTQGTPIITVRPNSTTPAANPAAAERCEVAVEVTNSDSSARIMDRVAKEKGGRPELTEASIVVSGGRGTNGDFAVIEKLADALGAAVGASRAATDAGWYPHQNQVGQTGKTVSPQLYFASGISGAIQHRAGMQTSKTIVAVNKDPEAPIFELVDYGVVGDLFVVLPQLTDEIEKRKA